MRSILSDNPKDWVERLPYVQSILRTAPMKALGGRSPYEVVLGIKPKYPSALVGVHPVEETCTDRYVANLAEYFRTTYLELQKKFESHVEESEGRGPGAESARLFVGDLVLVRREPSVRREGALRFQDRTYPEVYRVKSGGPASFHVEFAHNKDLKTDFAQPVRAERLIRLDMPEMRLEEGQPRTLQTLEPDQDPVTGWVTWRVEKFAVDGLVLLRHEANPNVVEWVDLSKKRYRWVLSGFLGP